MRVSTRLTVNALLPAVIAIAVLGTILMMNREVSRAERDFSKVTKIKDGIQELNLLTDDYLLVPGSARARSWHAHYRSLSSALSRIEPSDPSSEILVDRIRRNYGDLQVLFRKLSSLHAGHDPAMGRAWYTPDERELVRKLRAQTRSIFSDISLLSDATWSNVNARLKAAAILIVFFTVLLSGATALAQWKVNRRIALALVRLHRGTEVIGSGSLDFKVGTDADDEIGDLSRSFDRMAVQLRETMVSRDALGREVEERKRIERELQRLSGMYALVLQSAGDGIFGMDLKGNHILVNNSALRMLGYRTEELMGRHSHTLWHHTKPDGSPYPEQECNIYRTLRDGVSRHIDSEVFWKKDGTSIPVEYITTPMYEKGLITGTVVTFRDITERRKAEAALRTSEANYRAIFDSASDAIFVHDIRTGEILDVNRRMQEMYGYRCEELKGLSVGDLSAGTQSFTLQAALPFIEKAARGEPQLFDWLAKAKGSKLFWVEVSLKRVLLGGKDRLLAIVRDVSERKRAEEALRVSESRFRNLFTQSSLSMQILSPEGRTLEVNHAFEQLWGLKLADIRDYNILRDEQLFVKGVMPSIQKAFAGEAAEIPAAFYDPSKIAPSGRARWVKAFIYPVKAGAGGVRQVVLFHVDVTDMVKAEEQLRESENRFRAFFESAAIGNVQLDARTGKFLRMNRRFCEITGYECAELRSLTFNDLTHPEDRTVDNARFERMISDENAVYDNEKRYIRKDGRTVWVHVTASVVRDAAGRPVHTAGVVQDISERKKMEEEIRHMAQHDALTGLPNRRLFIDILKVELALTRRHGKKLALLFLDLDRFKEINDTLGHSAGDDLLKQVAARFRSTIRSSDTVARIGGDEFNIVLTGLGRTEDVADIAHKLVESFREPVFVAGRELHVTTSIGISIYPDDSEDPDTLLRYADIAMYHSKSTGRNRYTFFNSSINIRSLERMQFENYLRHTIAKGELQLRYQPEFDIATGKIVCVEALVRWQHPELGLLRPAQFIPVAEETGYVADIDDWVLGKACRQLSAWTEAGLDSFCLTVNLSARQFQGPGLVETLSRILRETGVDPRRLVLEVTEGTAMTDIDRTRPVMQKLAGMGIRISIDDFGTGCSSLNHLKRLPVERLKIDRSFIEDIADDPDDRAIVQAITAMAHSMKIKVTAEGVETEEQLALVRKAGCEEIQGYLFGEPLSAEEFTERLARG